MNRAPIFTDFSFFLFGFLFFGFFDFWLLVFFFFRGKESPMDLSVPRLAGGGETPAGEGPSSVFGASFGVG